jgi:hypothetical protein
MPDQSSRRARRRPGAALVLSVLALVVALSSTAEARRLIGSADIRNGSIRGVDIHSSTIPSSKLTLGLRLAVARHVRGDRGPGGPRGATGAKGSTGATGPAGAIDLGHIHVRVAASSSVGNNASASRTASCASGEKAISGGLTSSQNSAPNLVESSPNAAGTAWTVSVHNVSGGSIDIVPVAVCVAP